MSDMTSEQEESTGEQPPRSLNFGNEKEGAPAPEAKPESATQTPDWHRLPEDWASTLPEDLKDHASLKTMHDIPTMVKSFIEAQKMVGKNKIVIPDQHGSEEDWQKVYKKLGLPETLEEYELEIDHGGKLDEGFLTKFKEAAHKNGILPKQASAVMDWYLEQYKGISETNADEAVKEREEGFKKLDMEWGDSYRKNMVAAELALKDFSSDDVADYAQQKGWTQDPMFIKLLAAVGNSTKEAELTGKLPRGDMEAKSPEEARQEITDIQSDLGHPYYDVKHPNHKSAVASMENLYKYAYPASQKK